MKKLITQKEFDQILQNILKKQTGEQLLHIPGIYEILTEEYNNEVISVWEENNEENN